MDLSGARFHHEQDVEAAQCDGVEGEEVGGQQPGGLSAQEGSPSGVCSAWCWAEPGSGQDPSDGVGTHAVPESGEFALDSAVAPGGVFVGQAQHQLADLAGDRWAA
jgi:hypothetical protein